jgi:DNA polymerase elongation subunit (family B)
LRQDSGWLFDVYIKNDHAILWIRCEDGRMLRLEDAYVPFFHVKPVDLKAEQDLLYHLPELDGVGKAFSERKKTSLESAAESAVIRVEASGTGSFRSLVDGLEASRFVERVYGVDFRHSQRYLLTQLKVEPTSKVVVEHDDGRLTRLEKVDDSRELIPPPFTILRFRVGYEPTGRGRVITRIDTVSKNSEKRFEGAEHEIIASFVSYVKQVDPDIIFCPKCDEFTFPLLQGRAMANHAGLELGRAHDGEQVKAQGSFSGRAVLGDVFYGYTSDDWGIAGLVERARFAFLPIGLATRWKSNKSIDTRNSFELMERGYVIPRESYFESARRLTELVRRDRGGITITPEVGLHENVAALDFDSQFPNIIMRDGLSYEGNGYDDQAFRLIPTVIAPFTNRRLWLKKLKKTFPKGTDLRRYCEQRIETLKMIAVTQYGIAGCCWNRLGNVLTFEEINKASRNAMITAKSTAEAGGFKIIYGDIDSLFVQKSRATKEDYEELAAKMARASNLPMSLDRHFRFVGFLPLRRDSNSSALKRYFGLTYDGEVEARGIELRRSDTPELIREFQTLLIGQMLDCQGLREVYSAGIERGRELVRKTLALVNGGKIESDMLTVTRTLRKPVNQYRASAAHASAAVQLLASGQEVEAGDGIGFVYANAEHQNPLCRVVLPGHSDNYDRRMYSKLVVEAARTVFNALGVEPFPSVDSSQSKLPLA